MSGLLERTFGLDGVLGISLVLLGALRVSEGVSMRSQHGIAVQDDMD